MSPDKSVAHVPVCIGWRWTGIFHSTSGPRDRQVRPVSRWQRPPAMARRQIGRSRSRSHSASIETVRTARFMLGTVGLGMAGMSWLVELRLRFDSAPGDRVSPGLLARSHAPPALRVSSARSPGQSTCALDVGGSPGWPWIRECSDLQGRAQPSMSWARQAGWALPGAGARDRQQCLWLGVCTSPRFQALLAARDTPVSGTHSPWSVTGLSGRPCVSRGRLAGSSDVRSPVNEAHEVVRGTLRGRRRYLGPALRPR